MTPAQAGHHWFERASLENDARWITTENFPALQDCTLLHSSSANNSNCYIRYMLQWTYNVHPYPALGIALCNPWRCWGQFPPLWWLLETDDLWSAFQTKDDPLWTEWVAFAEERSACGSGWKHFGGYHIWRHVRWPKIKYEKINARQKATSKYVLNTGSLQLQFVTS